MIFKVEADDALIAIKEIETYRVCGVNICGNCGEISVIKTSMQWKKCNIHGICEGYRQIEVM